MKASIKIALGTDGVPDRAGLVRALLGYAVALAALLLVPPFLKPDVGLQGGFTLQELVDLATPVVVIPLAWLAVAAAGGAGRRWTLAFLAVAAVWVEAQGIHLGTNAVGDAFGEDGVAAFYSLPPGALSHWLDEVLSHWLWHGAWVAITAMLLAAAMTTPAGARLSRTLGSRLAPSLAGLVHGAVFFLVTVEGATAGLGIPASIGFLAWSGYLARRGSRHPVVWFVVVSTIATLAGYVIWAALHDWHLPEISGGKPI